MPRVKISQLPLLTTGSAETELVGNFRGTTYRISLSEITASIVQMLSESVDNRLDLLENFEANYTQMSASFVSIEQLNQLTESVDIRLDNLEILSQSYLDFTQSYYSDSSSFDGRLYELETAVDIDNYATTASFNDFTQSQNELNTTWATTGSNTFIGNQNISGSIGINSNSGSWTFKKDGTLTLPNGAGIYGDGLLQVDAIGGFKINSYTNEFGSGSEYWYFHTDGTLNVPGNIYGADNLLTIESFNEFTQSYYSDSSSVDGRLYELETKVDVDNYATTSSFNSFTESIDNRVSGLEAATSSYLTSLEGTNVWSSSTQLPTNIISSSTQISELGFISTSTDLSGLNTISASYLYFTQSYYSDSSSFDGRVYNLETKVDIDNYVTTASYNTDSASFDNRITAATNEQYLSGFATTSSLNIISASAWGAFQSASSYSSSVSTSVSILSSSVNSRLYTLETAVDIDNYVTTSSFNSFTQSTNNTIAGLTTIASFNSFTQSQNILNATWATTGSNIFKGNQIISGAIYISGSLIPNADTSYTSSFSLGSATNAWKDIWVSKGTINFLGDNGSVVSTLSGTPNGLSMANLVVSGSIFANSITGALLSTNGVISSSQQIASYGYATTGSNTFKQSQIISGSLTITQDLILLGSASVQYITSSQLNIADNIITVNTIQPSIRFGGLAVIDSGSNPQRSGSMLFDSQEDQWIYVHQNNSTITSSLLIMGAETYNNIGNEIHPTTNRVMKSIVDEHIGDSNITDDGTTITMLTNTNVTGSLKVTSAISASTFTGLGNLTAFSTSINNQLTALEIYSASLKNEFTISASQLFINTPNVNISGSTLSLNSINNNNIYFLAANVSTSTSGGGDGEGGGNTTTTKVTGSLVWDVINQYWKAGIYGSEVELADVNYVDTAINDLSSSVRTTIQTLSSSFASKALINSQSAWGAFQSASAISASGFLTDLTQSNQITSLTAKTGSYLTTSSFNAFTSSFNTISASFSTRIDAVDDNLVSTASFNTFTSSYLTDSSSFASKSLINSQSAFGAYASASAYSASIYTRDAGQDTQITANSASAASAFASASAYSSSFYTTINTNIGNITAASASAASAFASASAYSASAASALNSVSGAVATSFSASAANVTSISSSFSSSLSSVSASLNTRFNTFSSSINSLIIVQSASLFVTTASFNTFSSSYKTDSASFSTRIDAVDDNLVSTASFNTFTASYTTTSASFASKSLINSQSAWGAFTSASSYSASLAIAIQAVNDNLATTSSNTFIGNEIITGSLVVTGSIASNVVAVTISSSTASLDLSKGNNFTLTLSGSNTRIVATNIKPGITANLLITTGNNTSASFSSIFLQPSGSAYSASFGSGKKDIISLSSFDATTLYVTSVKNFVTQSVGGGG